MIQGFEDETGELAPHEKKLVPVIIEGLKARLGASTAIKGEEICRKINTDRIKYGFPASYKFTPPRLRKIVNFIRIQGILPVIATSKGYYTSYDQKEILKQINSLKERASAIQAVADSFNKFVKP